MQTKKIISINGPVILAKGDGDFSMHDIVYIGKEQILGDVIKINKDIVTIQVYENTTGLKIGEDVVSDENPLSVTLGPGLMGNIFDGIQRPLEDLRKKDGDFLKRGTKSLGISTEKKWHFRPKVLIGDKVGFNTIIGEVPETKLIIHKILNYFDGDGIVVEIANEGEYKVTDTIAKIKIGNSVVELTMMQKWPVRKPRPYKERLVTNTPLVTGQRVIDSIFPIAKGGTGMIPGGFGTGKTMLQHQFAKWSNADIIVYIGCGERGNEMTDVLEEFPRLIDKRTGMPMIERTVLIANTSNMPVAAREASIYTGITIAEYYRDMGFDVAIMADSTSRWAEALREISGRLEEMPAEQGFPSYLPSRLSEFYGRAGLVKSYSGKMGSVTIIGAVSPQGSDFSEPVTQNTKRFVHTFWGLDRDLAYSRHYPAVNWNISYSEYLDNLQSWYEENVDVDFLECRQKIVSILEEENELLEIARVVGQDVLSDSKRLVLEVAKAIRVGFLQQNAMSDIDSQVPLIKQYKMMQTIILLYERALKLIEKRIPLSEIKKLGFFEEYVKLKMNVANDDLGKFSELNSRIKNRLKKLEDEYVEHI
ncbi:MAG TPA: V-type ATP synthase subunit A [Clostridiaceae bacterium]|nr:V-type ATP synthase subunit A [Clostridiaceae bacterium]